jgi:intracellular septation protein
MSFEPAPNAPSHQNINPILKLALELGPLGVFFFANARGEWLAASLPALAALGGPLFIATAAFIAATLLSLAVSLALTRRLPIMPFVTGIVVLVFGGLTLWLHDETFIKMKPTIVNTLFGAVLLGGLLFGKSLLGYVFDSVFKLTDNGWRQLTFRWGIFFFVLAALNEIVWRTMTTDQWVAFKVFGIMPLTLVFTMFQLPLLNREQIVDAKRAE